MDGILNIHKPSGPTSFTVVARVRKLVNEPKAGHGGTLDPLASGVLPVFLGQATRLVEYLMEYPKTYRAELELGVATDSYDAEGTITRRGDVSGLTLADVTASLGKFRGDIRQTPPVYSALKYQGQPLYKLARQGVTVAPASRPTTVYRLDLISFNPPFLELEVECSRGTYIRSLAHDLGTDLGCGARLKGLIRTSYGPFDIKKAVTPDQLEASVSDFSWALLAQPMDTVLSLWERAHLSDEQVQAVRCGVPVALDISSDGGRVRAYDGNAALVALLGFDSGSCLWRPQKVFHQPQLCLKTAPTLDNEAANGYIA